MKGGAALDGSWDRKLRYVRVRCEVDEKGVPTPLAVLWTPSTSYEISEVVASCPWKCPGTHVGRRYTVRLGRFVTCIYWDGSRWYVNARVPRARERGAAA